MDCESADPVTSYFDLAGVQSCPHRYPEAPRLHTDRVGTPYGAGRAVEGGEESVAGSVDLAATVAAESGPDSRIVRTEKLRPSVVADTRCSLG